MVKSFKKFIFTVTLILVCFNSFALSGVPDDIKTYTNFSKWVMNNFYYKFAFKKYIQYPEETIRLKTGVCGDFAVLYSAFLSEQKIDNEILIVQFKGIVQLHAICIWKDNSGNYIVSSNKTLIYTYKKDFFEAIHYMYYDVERLFKIEKKEQLYKYRSFPQPTVFMSPIKLKPPTERS